VILPSSFVSGVHGITRFDSVGPSLEYKTGVARVPVDPVDKDDVSQEYTV